MISTTWMIEFKHTDEELLQIEQRRNQQQPGKEAGETGGVPEGAVARCPQRKRAANRGTCCRPVFRFQYETSPVE